MNTRRAEVSLVFALILACAMAACAPNYHTKDERYVFVATNINLPYWQEAEAGLRDASSVIGVKAEMIGPDSFSPEKELDTFNTVIAENPSGIMLSAARPDIFQSAIEGAIAKGIPVICVDADAPDSKRILFVGTDNYRAGEESGRRIGEAMKGQGNLVVITIPGQLNLEERLRGVTDALKKYPGIKVTQTLDDRGDPRSANDQISALLAKKEKIDGILCLEASGGAGAAEALHRTDQTGKIAILAFDKEPETLDWIDRGAITATIAQKPYTMAYYGLRFLDDLHHNAVHEFKDWRTAPVTPMPTFVDTGTAIIDKDNLKIFREALAAHPKPL